MCNEMRTWIACAMLLACLASACTPGEDTRAPSNTSSEGPAEQANSGTTARTCSDPLPDLSRVSEAVQSQIRTQHAVIIGLSDDATEEALAEAHGTLGMVLMAAWFPEAAEPCFQRAADLAPSDRRWPYYLAHVFRDRGDLNASAEMFEAAIELDPAPYTSLIWLGNVRLDQGHTADARPYFDRALTMNPESLTARLGLGQAALDEEQYDQAVEVLEEILEINPDIGAVHYPLGMAYRGIGNDAKATEHLEQRENADIRTEDPLLDALNELLVSPNTYEARGERAASEQDWPAAIAEFRQGLELDPENAPLRHQFATALYLSGDRNAAITEFERVIRTAPEFAPSQYGLGVLFQENGRHQDAVRLFRTALQAMPTDPSVKIRLATSLRQSGEPTLSLEHYRSVLAQDDTIAEARFGEAMALIQLSLYREARDRLAAALEQFPDERSFPHALARILAAAPDDTVRNGQQALSIVEWLAPGEETIDLGETMAMTLAELGRFEEASAIQRELVTVVEALDAPEFVVRRLRRNLELYQRREPCRTPWPADAMP